MPITPHRATRPDNRRLSGHGVVQGPQVGETYLKIKGLPQAATIREVRASTDTGTVDFNIEVRSDFHSAGTDLFASDKQATTTEQTWTAFASPSAGAKTDLFVTVSATSGSPNVVDVNVEWTLD